MIRLIYSSVILLLPLVVESQEMLIAKDSASIPSQTPSAAVFFNSTLDISYIIPGNPNELKDQEVVSQLFQKLSKRYVPIQTATSVTKIQVGDTGFAEVSVKIDVPKLKAPSKMVVRTQLKEAKESRRDFYFTAIPDTQLTDLAKQHTIRSNGAKEIAQGFRDREIKVTSGDLEDIRKGRDWSGLWFIQLKGDDRKNLELPLSLLSDQIIIILEQPETENTYMSPIAQQRGAGWIIHLSATWANQFTTNAGVQFSLINTINQILKK